LSSSIRYVVEGKGEPVTLIHGVGSNLESWDPVVQHMKADYTILRLDLRGHGSSPGITRDCTLADFVDDVSNAMDAAGFDKSDLVGFSLGGMIAQLFAINHPERVDRLALLSAVAGRTPEEKRRLANRAQTVREEGVGAVLGESDKRWFTDVFRQANPEKVAQRMKEMLANDPASYAEAYRIFAESDVGDQIHAIKHRTLVATGEHDAGSNTRMARFMHDQINNSELVIFPDLRHSILVEAPDIITDLLFKFLDRSANPNK
jgi:pimeloyl-ACP methyl ester carboxylesterase